MRSRVLMVGALLTTVALAAGACTSTPVAVAPTTTQAPRPAGTRPSPIATQVCHEAVKDVNEVLGIKAKVSTPTWVGHLYSCQYGYPHGSMQVSVKELSSWAQTDAYFDFLASELGRTRTLQGLGQGAFQTTSGSVVVRKDWKVLLVDTRGLPSRFGVPPTSSSDVAVTVGDVILGCWAGD